MTDLLSRNCAILARATARTEAALGPYPSETIYSPGPYPSEAVVRDVMSRMFALHDRQRAWVRARRAFLAEMADA